jgi:hypothetical protein
MSILASHLHFYELLGTRDGNTTRVCLAFHVLPTGFQSRKRSKKRIWNRNMNMDQIDISQTNGLVHHIELFSVIYSFKSPTSSVVNMYDDSFVDEIRSFLKGF